MRALVIGGGSIGKRHLQNLRALGIEQLALVEPDAARGSSVAAELGIECFETLRRGFGFAPDFAIICSPTHLHIEHALAVASRGIDLFVEKPLSHSEERLAELCEIVERKGLISLVGCNMRLHPGPAKVKELLIQGKIGRLLFARIHAGSYLPNWRPGTDYRQNYAARKDTGGGCILDCIHELDLCRWYLGDIAEVFCLAQRISSLDIETEDIAIFICRHAGGAISEIHLDYVQRTYERGCQIVGERGSIFWDFAKAEVRAFDADSAQWESFVQPRDWMINQMYVDEMRQFVECVRARSTTILPISEAMNVMQIAFVGKASAKAGAMRPVLQGVPA